MFCKQEFKVRSLRALLHCNNLKIVGLLFTVAEKWGLVFNTPPKESFNDDILKSCKYLLMVQKGKNHFLSNLYLFVNIFCYDHRYMSWIQVTDLKFMDDITHTYVYKHSNLYKVNKIPQIKIALLKNMKAIYNNDSRKR